MHLAIRALAVLTAASAALLPVSAPAQAHTRDSGRHVLIHNPENNCELGADAIPGTGSPSRSGVVLHRTRGGVKVRITLRNAAPRTTYHVYVIHADGEVTPSSAPDCLDEDGTLMTDRSGNGRLRLNEPDLRGHPFIHVYLYAWTSAGLDKYDTGLIRTSTCR